MLNLFLIRHAESEMNNRLDLIGGRSMNSPLSLRGVEQANLLGARFKNNGIVFDEIYSFTAKRAMDTAMKTCEQFGISKENIVLSSEILELDQGEWEGKLRDKIYTTELLNSINKDPWNFAPKKGESQKDVEERMLKWVNSTLIPKHFQNITVGVFTHGMAIKCLLRGILDFSPQHTYKINLDNASITRLRYDERGGHLISVNDVARLVGK